MALADVAVDLQDPFYRQLADTDRSLLDERFASLEERARDKLVSQGQTAESISYERFLSLQYQGSDTTLMIREPENGDYAASFLAEHKREFAFVLDAQVMVAGVRVRAAAKAVNAAVEASPYMAELEQARRASAEEARPFGTNSVYFEEVGQFTDIPLFRLEELPWGANIAGPAIILDNTQTIVLHPQNKATILRSHVM